jgi:hypothetical protein
MVDQNDPYISGRGKPTYLLDRINNDYSTDSDGASRIFIDTNSTITISNDSNSWNTSNIPNSSSCFSMSSIYDTSNMVSNTESNSYQYNTNSLMSMEYSKSYDTQYSGHDNQSDANNTWSTDTSYGPTYERSEHEEAPVSSIAFLFSHLNDSTCLANDDNYTKIWADPDYGSEVFSKPEDMFASYISSDPKSSSGIEERRQTSVLSNRKF